MHNNSNTVSIMKGADTYTSGDPVPLDVGSNVITIEVTSADDPLTTHIYTVDVTRAPNTPPTFDDGRTTTRGVDENTFAGRDIGDPVEATDTENDTLTYSLDATSAAYFDIDESSGQLQTKADLDHETKSSYTVTVSVRDSMDANGDADEVTDDTITVTIQVADLNEDPEFPISETGIRSVDENTVEGVNFGAPVAASDDDDDPLTYSLDDSRDADSFSIDASSGQLRTRAALDYETGPNSYIVDVTAADPSGLNDTIEVTITVNNVDEDGTVTLSSTQPIEGTLLTATLDDPDNVSGSVTWSWRRSQSRTSLGTLISGATAATYTPVAADVGRFLRATASYTDGEDSGKSALAVSGNRVQAAPVQPNSSPEFPSDTAGRNVPENTVAGRDIGAPVAASDDDDDPLTYSLGGTNRASFAIDESSGQLRTRASLNFEGKSSYRVTVTAADPAGETDTITVTITVNNVDEDGTVTLSSTQPIVGTPLTATLDDPDNVSGSVTWSWARSRNRTSSGTLISGETSATYTPVTADETRFLRATASYDDGAGSDKSAEAVSTNAVEPAPVPQNEPPAFVESSPAMRNVNENTPAGGTIGAPVEATDPENDTLTYSLDVTSRATFGIDASSGQLQTKGALDYETAPRYTVTVTAADPAGADDTITVTINVINVNEAGTVTLSSLQPIEGTLLTATLDDPDNVGSGSVTWSWARSLNRNSWTLISGETSATYTPVADDVGDYLRAIASYTDGAGPGKSALAVSGNRVQAAPVQPNSPPYFPPSENRARNVDENTPVGTDFGAPVAASDDDNDTLTYSLGGTNRASFAIDESSGQLRTRAPLNFEVKSSYSVIVTATDPAGASHGIIVTITVINVNEPGTVTLSSTQPSAETPLTATLDDPDNVSGSVTWSWERSLNRNSSWTPISGETSATYTPVAADENHYLRATASYDDGEGSGKSAEGVSANVVQAAPAPQNEPPMFSSNTAARNVEENTARGVNIGARVTATDPNNDTLTYSLDVPSRATFNIVATTGRLQTKAALDYETGTHSYTVTVAATDPAGLYDTIEVTITVINVDEAGTVTLSSTQPQVIFQLTATLDDPDNVRGSVTWSWESSLNRSSSWTIISGKTSATYTPVAADVNHYLRATASYDDGEGPGKRAEGVSANVVQAAPVTPNEPPIFVESPPATRNVDENTPADRNIGAPVAATDPENDTLTYSLDVPSRATFNIVATTGRLQTKAALDYETGTHTYTVTVTATDPAGLYDTIEVTITVNNVEEPGTVTLSSLQPQVGFQLTATLDDPDNVSGSVTWSWRSSPNRNSLGTLINGETSATYTPVAADVGDYLRATASYDDGEEPGKSAEGVSTNRVEAAPVPQNEPPEFPTNTAARNVDENTSPGEDIGERVAATDDADDTLTYSLDGTNRATFAIDASSGQLQTRAPLNFEVKSSYTVTVTATDTAGQTDTITVNISVNNVEEPGTVTLSSTQPQVRFQLTATLNDLDDVRGSVTWSWARSQNMTSSWTPIVGATSAAYTPVAADVGGFLQATASYTDGEGPGKRAQAVSTNSVLAAPVAPNDPPIFVESPPATRNVDENTPAGMDIGEPVAATDPDTDPLTYSLDAPAGPPSTLSTSPASCGPRLLWTLKRPIITS